LSVAAPPESLERSTPTAAALAMMLVYEDITAMLGMEIQRAVEAAGIPARGDGVQGDGGQTQVTQDLRTATLPLVRR
jgi:hypothetical protein